MINMNRHDFFGKDFVDSLMKLLVLLTTANNPDGIYYIILTLSILDSSKLSSLEVGPWLAL